MESLHAGVYKLRLRNESGVFECIANVAIDNPENKLKKLEEQRKKEEKEKQQREEEERKQKEEEERLNYVNKNLSDVKVDGKDEDKDSGLKIGEESANGSDYEYEYSDDYEDYYEDEDENQYDIVGNKDNNIIQNENDNDHILLISENTSNENQEANPREKSLDKSSVSEEKEDNLEDEVCDIIENLNNNNDQSSNEKSNILMNLELENTSNENQEEEHPREKSHVKPFVNKEKEDYFEHKEIRSDIIENLNNNNDQNSNAISENINTLLNLENTSNENNEEGHSKEDSPVNFSLSEEKQYSKDQIESCVSYIEKEFLYEGECIKCEEDQKTLANNSSKLQPDSNDETYLTEGENVEPELNTDKTNETISQNGQKIIDSDLDSQSHENLDVLTKDRKPTHNEMSDPGAEYSAEIMDALESNETESESHLVIEECRTPTPEILFNKEEYIQTKTESLEKNLSSAGFIKSNSMIETVNEGDQCLLHLLDQMKREDQDFKVWERDDFSFLRWYVTRQMETLYGKVDNLKFVDSIDGDFFEYINRISQDGVPIDRTFIQAAATIFNKDIILIPAEADTEYDVVVGGLNNGKNKGSPLYLGHIKQAENCPDIFVSVMPDKIDKEKVSNILSGDLRIKENDQESSYDENAVVEEADVSLGMTNLDAYQWTRMDSFNGSSVKMDTIINEIINGENLDELFKQADCDDDDSDDDDELSECDTVGTIHETDPSTPDASDLNLFESSSKEEIKKGPYLPSENPNIEVNQDDDNEVKNECMDEDPSVERVESMEEENENWVYDEESGYWIIKDEATENIYESKEQNEAESNDYNNNLKEFVENQFQTSESFPENQPSDSNDPEYTESIILENVSQNQSDDSSGNFDNSTIELVGLIDEGEKPNEPYSIDSKNNDDIEGIDARTEEESHQKSKQINRKIKISVSVSGDDKVNCDSNISSDPVTLDHQSEYFCNFYLMLSNNIQVDSFYQRYSPLNHKI